MLIPEQQPDSHPSLGLNSDTLRSFKQHAVLPTESSWVEADNLLRTYLDAAERQVDALTGSPYRVRNFKCYFDCWSRSGIYYGISIPMRPPVAGITIDWTDNDEATGQYIEDTDFRVHGRGSLEPYLLLPHGTELPHTDLVHHAYVMTFSAGGDQRFSSALLIAIFELATCYYRTPEAMQMKPDFISMAFQANLDLAKASFL